MDAPRASTPFAPPIAEGFLLVYDVSDEVATLVNADAGEVWDALLDADLLEVGRSSHLAVLLGALRMLPDVANSLIRERRLPSAPASMRLRELTELPPDRGGWVLLGERPGQEIALGLVGKFWRPVIQWAHVGRDEFRDFDEPGFGKTVYDLRVLQIGDGRTLLTGLMRTATTDAAARRWFRRYWTFGVGSGAHVLVQALLDMVRDDAERRSRPGGPAGTGDFDPRYRIRFSSANRVFLGLLGMGPSVSDVHVDAERVRARMGWAFAADLPRTAIRAAAPEPRMPFPGWGVHGWRGRWLVNGSSRGLVRIDVEPPQPARVVGVRVMVRELHVSVEEPDALAAALAAREATGGSCRPGSPPVGTDRAGIIPSGDRGLPAIRHPESGGRTDANRRRRDRSG